MGLTKKQKDERAAVKAGTHEWAEDTFGNRYLSVLPLQPAQLKCVHCGGKAIEIIGKQITPGDLAPYKHMAGQARAGCPKQWGPLQESDVRAA